MRLNDLNEKFEDIEKENTASTFQGLMKITGIIVSAVFLVLFKRIMHMQYHFSLVMKFRSINSREKIIMLVIIFTLFSFIVIVVSATIFIKMIKEYFVENSMEISRKIYYYVMLIIGILISINSIIGISELSKLIKVNLTLINRIMLFLFSGIPSGISATATTAFFSTVFLFSVKTYEEELYENRVIGIVYTVIASIIGLAGVNLIMELSYLYNTYLFSGRRDFNFFIHFLKDVLRYQNIQEKTFDMYFYVNFFVIILLTILLIFAKKNREDE